MIFAKKLWKKNNTWNIRALVGGSLGQMNQRTSVIYYKLTIFNTDLLLARFCGLGVAPFPFPVQLATSKCRFCSIWSDLGVSGLVVLRPNPLTPLGSTRGSARWWWWTVFRLVCTDIGCNCLFWPLSGPKFSEVVELNLRHVLIWKKKCFGGSFQS